MKHRRVCNDVEIAETHSYGIKIYIQSHQRNKHFREHLELVTLVKKKKFNIRVARIV